MSLGAFSRHAFLRWAGAPAPDLDSSPHPAGVGPRGRRPGTRPPLRPRGVLRRGDGPELVDPVGCHRGRVHRDRRGAAVGSRDRGGRRPPAPTGGCARRGRRGRVRRHRRRRVRRRRHPPARCLRCGEGAARLAARGGHGPAPSARRRRRDGRARYRARRGRGPLPGRRPRQRRPHRTPGLRAPADRRSLVGGERTTRRLEPFPALGRHARPAGQAWRARRRRWDGSRRSAGRAGDGRGPGAARTSVAVDGHPASCPRARARHGVGGRRPPRTVHDSPRRRRGHDRGSDRPRRYGDRRPRRPRPDGRRPAHRLGPRGRAHPRADTRRGPRHRARPGRDLARRGVRRPRRVRAGEGAHVPAARAPGRGGPGRARAA